MPTSIWIPDVLTLRLVLPELVLVATLAALLIAPMIAGRSARLSGGIALIGALLAAGAAWVTFAPVSGAPREIFSTDAAPGMLVADPLGMYFRAFLMLFLVGVLAVWFLIDAERERHAPEFMTLLVSSALGMALMSTTVNLLLMLIAIELASLPSYALVGFDRFRRPAAEASLKYVLFGAVCAGFSVFGVSLLFGMFGTLHLPTLVQRLAAAGADVHAAPLLAVALLAVFVGIGFKISAVPMHFWCPDAFHGASLPVATWLSVASKAAGLVLLLRLVSIFCAPDAVQYERNVLPLIGWGVALFAAVTCTVANLAAFQQYNIRRLLAYSSIAHAGYMLAAGAVVMTGGSPEPTSAVIQYLLVYMFMNLGAFLALGLVAVDTGSEEIDAFRGLGWRDGPVAAALTLCLVSLIGLPPMGGFIAKWWLLWALGGAAGDGATPVTNALWMLVFVIVINTALSLFYYARIIREMYLRGMQVQGGPLQAPALGKLTVHACAVVLLLTGLLTIGPLKRGADAIMAASTSQAPTGVSVAGPR